MRSSSVVSRASRVKENARPTTLSRTLKSSTSVSLAAPAPLRSSRKPILGATVVGAGPVVASAVPASSSTLSVAAPAPRQPLFRRPTLEASGLPSFVEEIDRVFEHKDYSSILSSMWKSKPPGVDFKVTEGAHEKALWPRIFPHHFPPLFCTVATRRDDARAYHETQGHNS